MLIKHSVKRLARQADWKLIRSQLLTLTCVIVNLLHRLMTGLTTVADL